MAWQETAEKTENVERASIGVYLSSLVLMYCARIVSEFHRRSLYGTASTCLSSAHCQNTRWFMSK
jgi:hypothetical protein